jgi:hypothetical protein
MARGACGGQMAAREAPSPHEELDLHLAVDP